MTHLPTAQIAAHELNWPRRAIYTAHILPCEALICYVAVCSCITFALLAPLWLHRHRFSLWPPIASFARRAVAVPRPVVTQQMRICGSGLVVLLRNKIPDSLRRGSLETQAVVLLPRSALRLWAKVDALVALASVKLRAPQRKRSHIPSSRREGPVSLGPARFAHDVT